MNIEKRGFTIGFSWEMLAPADGHSEPIGVRWVQWLGWIYYRGVWAIYRAIQRLLSKSRHYSPVGGYDWEDEEFRAFTQKMRWVAE